MNRNATTLLRVWQAVSLGIGIAFGSPALAATGNYRLHVWWKEGGPVRSEVTWADGRAVLGNAIQFSMGDLVTIEGESPQRFVGRRESYQATVSCFTDRHREWKPEVKWHDYETKEGGFLGIGETTVKHHDKYTINHPITVFDPGDVYQDREPFRLDCTTFENVIPILELQRRQDPGHKESDLVPVQTTGSGGRGLQYFQVMPSSGQLRLERVEISPGTAWRINEGLPASMRHTLDEQVREWEGGLCNDPAALGCLRSPAGFGCSVSDSGPTLTRYDGGEGFELWIRVEVR